MTLPLAAIEFFGQKADPHDVVIVALLVVLEGVLSIDNALVLGLLAKRVPKHLQGRALTYGLVGALIFRMAAIGAATWLLQWTFAKFLGGAYLIYVAAKHFFFEDAQEIKVDEVPDEPTHSKTGKVITAGSMSFWYTVIVIELTDIAFAIDSILAAIALVGQQRADDTGVHDKLWVVIVGGFIGVVVMRFAAILFIRLLEKFPRFEVSAYLLVLVIGGKLLADWGFNNKDHPHRVDFHDYRNPAFWIFWSLMIICFCIGFLPKREKASQPDIVKKTSG
jgi:YkoY family integral membrane protein